MSDKIAIVIQGASCIDDVPNLASISEYADIRFATDHDSLARALPGAEVLFGWNFRADDLENCWDLATDLKWIHWGGAGVDAAMFTELAHSDVTLTNSRGIFDRAMAEWTLGMMIAHAKRIPESFGFQHAREWNYRLNTLMAGQKVLVVGVGSIGRAVARISRTFGLDVTGIGRTARDGDPDFGHIQARKDLPNALGSADYVVLITPLTPETEDMFDAEQFAAMKPEAQFINIGRGRLVDEDALLSALQNGEIGGAALDVFREEPLPSENPLWSAPNTVISPHNSGDFEGHQTTLAALFLMNFRCYRAGTRLTNLVDKSVGFVPSGAP